MSTLSVLESNVVELRRETFEKEKLPVQDWLKSGKVIVVRQAEEALGFRNLFLEYVAHLGGPAAREAVISFLDNKTIPAPEVLAYIADAVKVVRAKKVLSVLLADIVQQCHFISPIVIGDGIPRVVVPQPVLEQIQQRTDLFVSTDFKRETSDGPTEIFMSAPSPPHRDLHRYHYTFQCNFWMPLHRMDESETLMLFPEAYRKKINTDVRLNERALAEELGEPLRIPLEVGDMILFHSEFVHGSPQTDSLKSRRLSYDVRAAARCFDDNTSYRRNFSSLNNFITLKKNDSVEKARRVMFQVSKEIELEHYLKNPKQDIPVQFFVNQLSEEKNIDAERFELYLKVYDLFPFAEDRYLQLTKEAHNLSHKLGEKFLEKTLKQSKSFFWSFCCGETAREWGAKGIAKKAFKKAIQLAKKTKLEFLGHPIEYDATRGGHCLQILPDQVKQQAKEKLHNL